MQPVDKSSFQDPDAAGNKAQLQSYLDAAGSRGTPYTSSATLGPAATFEGVKAAPTTLDTSQDSASRAYQHELLQRLNAQAQGQGPSLAGEQLKQGYDAQMSQAAALAGSMRGRGNPNLAMQQLGMQQSQAGATLNQQMASARIAEIMGANSQMGAVASGMRGQDQATAAMQAQLAQQTALANAGYGQQAGLFNASTANDFTKTAAGYQQQTSLANQMAELQARGMNDAQARAMMAAKLGISEQEMAAKMAYEQMHMQQQQGAAGIDAQAYANAQANYYKMVAAAGQAIGASDERVKENVRPGAASLHALLDSYGARGQSHSPVESKMNIEGGGSRIHAFLTSLGRGGMQTPTIRTSDENPLMAIPQGIDAGKAKDAAASQKSTKDDLDAKAASSDTAMMQGKLQDKAVSTDLAMRRNPGPSFDPSAWSGNNGLNASGSPATVTPPSNFGPDTSPANVLGPMPQGQAMPPAPSAPPNAPPGPPPPQYGQADMATLNAIAASKPQGMMAAPGAYQGATGPGNADMNALEQIAKMYPAGSMGPQMPPAPMGQPAGPMNPNQPGVTNISPQYIAMSDENEKSNAGPGSADLHAMLKSLGAHSYNYKEPEKPGRGEGAFISPMAQEFLRTPLGANMVRDTPDGLMVDYGKAGGLTFAALSDLHKRVSAIEGKKGKAA